MIPFVGLKTGVHEFDFEITDSFFEALDYSDIENGNVQVHLSLEKKETMLIGLFNIQGTVETQCDRCNDPVELQVKGNYKLIYKFGHEQEDDESLVVLHPDEYEINVEPAIYEFILVSLPNRRLHKKGECNEEMVNLIQKYSNVSLTEEDDEDFEDDWDDDDDFDDEEE